MRDNLFNKNVVEFVHSFSNAKTQQVYSKTLNDFGEYLHANGQDISDSTLLSYQHYLRSSDYSPRSYIVKTQIIRAFFKKYYPDFATIDDLTFHQDKVREIASMYVSNASFYRTLNHAKEIYGFNLEKLFRFLVVARTIMETGLRVEELVSIQNGDLESNNKIITIRCKTPRNICVSDVLSLEIEAYLRIKAVSGNYLISDLRHGDKITTRSLDRLFEEVEHNYTPRDLRHTFMCNERYLGRTFKDIALKVGGLPPTSVNYLSDRVQQLLHAGRVNIYKPKAIENAWLLHIIDAILKHSGSEDKFIRTKDFTRPIYTKNSAIDRIFRYVFRFPVAKTEGDNSFYYIDNVELVNNLKSYYAYKGKHESPKSDIDSGLQYDEWMRSGQEPRLDCSVRDLLKELPSLKYKEDVILWQKDDIQRRLRREGREYSLYDYNLTSNHAWFIMRSTENRSILFAANNFPCILFNDKIPRATALQSKENRLIKQRLYWNQSKKYRKS